MSGFTALQTNTTRRVLDKIDGPAAIAEALRRKGHEVDWRVVAPGEDLSSYDVAWVNLAPLNSLNGRKGAMGALWMLSEPGLPIAALWEDWQVNCVTNGARALVRKPDILYKVMPNSERYFMSCTDDEIRPHHDRLVAAGEALLGPRWAQGMVSVCPMYRWGDRSGVIKRLPSEIVGNEELDLSPTIFPMLARHAEVPMDEKKREWLLAALIPHGDWLDKQPIKWPVHLVGPKKYVRERNAERLKTEDEVIDRYAERVAALSPPYMHAGSGWWRSRFLYCAKIGSILVCDKGEGASLGPAYQIKPDHVEQWTNDELTQVVEAQRAALRPWLTTQQEFDDHCDRIVRRAVAEDNGMKR